MKRLLILPFFLILFFNGYTQATTIYCEIKTSIGSITVELFSHKAPLTVANFMRYVESEYFDNTSFFRVCTPENEADRSVKIEVIQGGEIKEPLLYNPIPLETTHQTNLKHLDGTISMARDTPNSAQSSFFICINNQPELDYGGKRNSDGQGFAAFGQVIKGMDVVRTIQKGKNTEQRLLNPVTIYSIRKIEHK